MWNVQVQQRAKEAKKLLTAADSAITEFEEGSQAWLKLGKQLDTALRQLGDIDNLFDTLQARTSSLSQRIVALIAPADPPVSQALPPSGQPTHESGQEDVDVDAAAGTSQAATHAVPQSHADHAGGNSKAEPA